MFDRKIPFSILDNEKLCSVFSLPVLFVLVEFVAVYLLDRARVKDPLENPDILRSRLGMRIQCDVTDLIDLFYKIL